MTRISDEIRQKVVRTHILYDDIKNNAELFERAFYSGKEIEITEGGQGMGRCKGGEATGKNRGCGPSSAGKNSGKSGTGHPTVNLGKRIDSK